MPGELTILAAVIDAGNVPLPPGVARIIQSAPDSFDDQRAGQIASIVRAMRAKGDAINAAIIVSKHPQYSDFITRELLPVAMDLDTAEYEARACWDAYLVRQARTILGEAQQSLEAAPKQAPAIIAAVRTALEAIAGDSDALPDLVDAASFIGQLIEPPAELVAGILHRGSKLAFGGSSKSFKTWCLLDFAISVAAGVVWMGHPTAQGKVLFVNFEIQPHAWQKRIVAVAQAKGIQIQLGQIHLLNLRGHAADFRQLIPRILQRARREGYALIVLDPIYKLYGRTDENAAGDVADLLNALERLAMETGAAIAFGAHFAKGNASAKEAIDRISGSGVFARDPDSLLIFTKHETDDAFTVEPILRNFPPVPPFVVRWEFPLMMPADDLDPAKLKKVAGRKKEHDPKKLLAAIADTTPQNPISVSKWAGLKAAGNVPRQTLTDYLPEMRKMGWIETIGEGNTARQCITAKGKGFINANEHDGN